ncbi:metallophosphoesterase [Lachnospiraceae bacterium 47-T17]
MGKNAYLIVSDMHNFYRNLANRIDYREEMRIVEDELLSIAVKYKTDGYNVIMILLGDVFHNSYNDVFKAILDSSFFIMWDRLFGKIYSVIGNHELTYYSSNPFYTLVDSIESQKVQNIMNKTWQPLGLMPVITVPDELRDGNVVFHFNHYSTPISKSENGRINIGLFHQEIINKQIITLMEQQLQTYVFANPVDFDGLDVFDGYAYCFFGHMHKAYGVFKTENGCILAYLASLGRTNVGEVLDTFLERNVPAVLVSDGDLVCVESNKFSLQKRSECVNEAAVEKAHETYEIQQQKKALKRYIPASDDPVDNLKSRFMGNAEVIMLIDELRANDMDTKGIELLGKANRIDGNK